MPAQAPKASLTLVRDDGTLDERNRFVCFNPTEYTLDKRVQIAEHAIPGLDAPILQFVRGQNETLTFDLFFDTTSGGMGADARPVTTETDRFYGAVKINGQTHKPAIYLFKWGGVHFPGAYLSESEFPNQRRTDGFKCVVESVRQRFTLFSTTGVPLRAVLTLTLREYKTLDEQITQLNLQSADQTHAHTVRQGETLTTIANKIYGNPREWRRIAAKNRITDPLALQPGAILEIPPTEVGARA